MARIYRLHPVRRRSHRRNAGGREWGLGILLAALLGWNLNAWLLPSPANSPQPSAELITPDPWAISREQRRLLEAQEGSPVAFADMNQESVATTATSATYFPICGNGQRVTCVVDGDTFWLQGQKIRVADIDTPEISSPRCDAELQLGQRAKQRMQQLLNAGPIALEPADRATDRYGRALFRVTRNGESLGGTLVGEGLAVWYGNGKPDWC